MVSSEAVQSTVFTGGGTSGSTSGSALTKPLALRGLGGPLLDLPTCHGNRASGSRWSAKLDGVDLGKHVTGDLKPNGLLCKLWLVQNFHEFHFSNFF
jgi:hypothetical protein